ncbi:hypothetical protein V2J09_006652 [Rumex salicifolius]
MQLKRGCISSLLNRRKKKTTTAIPALQTLINQSGEIKADQIKAKAMGSETLIEVILAILLPPVGVFLRYGCGVEFWICLLLTILGYIPGIIYALYVLVA